MKDLEGKEHRVIGNKAARPHTVAGRSKKPSGFIQSSRLAALSARLGVLNIKADKHFAGVKRRAGSRALVKQQRLLFQSRLLITSRNCVHNSNYTKLKGLYYTMLSLSSLCN